MCSSFPECYVVNWSKSTGKNVASHWTKTEGSTSVLKYLSEKLYRNSYQTVAAEFAVNWSGLYSTCP